MSSSNQSQQQRMQPPYIGSKISLISKLDIRYEGILYTVDPVESTIALAKVHSYGTEERRTPVFVPPRDEVYDFIIFKASDIKDLIVCEQPKAINNHSNIVAGLPYDPAIVLISKNPPPEPKLPPNLNVMGASSAGTGFGGGHHANANIPAKSGSRHSYEHLLGGPMRFNYRFPNFQPHYNPQRNKHHGANSHAVEVFDKDYDFEKANEQFREKIIEDLSAATTNDTQMNEFYNKRNSFFDNISCDALEKESGKNVRPDWKRERQTNQETFGHSAVRSLFFQRRGVRPFGVGSSSAHFPLY